MSGLPTDGKSRTLDAIMARLSGQTQEKKLGACKKCGYVGHLAFQCRNYMPVGDTGEVHLDVSSTSSDTETSEDDLGRLSDDAGRDRSRSRSRSPVSRREKSEKTDRKHYLSRRERDRLHKSGSDSDDDRKHRHKKHRKERKHKKEKKHHKKDKKKKRTKHSKKDRKHRRHSDSE